MKCAELIHIGQKVSGNLISNIFPVAELKGVLQNIQLGGSMPLLIRWTPNFVYFFSSYDTISVDTWSNLTRTKLKELII